MDTLTVDVRNLPDEKVRELEQLIEFWKKAAQATKETTQPTGNTDAKEVTFTTQKSRVIGALTRHEIYEYH